MQRKRSHSLKSFKRIPPPPRQLLLSSGTVPIVSPTSVSTFPSSPSPSRKISGILLPPRSHTTPRRASFSGSTAASASTLLPSRLFVPPPRNVGVVEPAFAFEATVRQWTNKGLHAHRTNSLKQICLRRCADRACLARCLAPRRQIRCLWSAERKVAHVCRLTVHHRVARATAETTE